MAIDFLASGTVDPMLHPVRVVWEALGFQNERHLPAMPLAAVGRGGITQTAVLEVTASTVGQTSLEEQLGLAARVRPLATQPERMARRAVASLRHRIELELAGGNDLFPVFISSRLMALAVLVLLRGELRVTTTEAVVGDIAVDAALVQILHVGFVGEAGIRRHHCAGLVNLLGDAQLLKAGLDRLQHRLQGVMFLAFAEGLGVQDDLMFLVHRRHPVIALDRALAGGHLGGLIVREVALHFLEALPLAPPGVVRLRKRSILVAAASSAWTVRAWQITRSISASVSA